MTAPVAIDYTNEPTIGNTFFAEASTEIATVMTGVDAPGFFDMVVERVGSL